MATCVAKEGLGESKVLGRASAQPAVRAALCAAGTGRESQQAAVRSPVPPQCLPGEPGSFFPSNSIYFYRGKVQIT